jgi:hypothetical protein
MYASESFVGYGLSAQDKPVYCAVEFEDGRRQYLGGGCEAQFADLKRHALDVEVCRSPAVPTPHHAQELYTGSVFVRCRSD